MHLNEILKTKVKNWRDSGYKCDYPVIREIFEYNFLDSESQNLRYLRKAQFEALETYWYLRIVENTSHIFDLYKKYFQGKDLRDALNIKLTPEDLEKIAYSNGGGIDTVFKKIKKDNDFVKKYHFEGLRESLFLDYPSYILALAMGAVE